MIVNAQMSRRHSRALRVSGLFALCVLLGSCARDSDTTTVASTCGELPFTPPPSTSSSSQTPVAIAPIARVADATDAAVDPGTGDLYVTTRDGVIWRKHDDSPPMKWVDLSASITDTGDEQGLLALVFSLDHTQVYVSFTATHGTVVVDVLDTADGIRVETLLEVSKRSPFHNGGGLLVEPGRRVLVGIGDDNPPDTVNDGRAQDPATPYGKIVELDPADPSRPVEVIAMGLRNPWRFSADADGSLWIGDVGERCAEELNHLSADAPRPVNFGWPLREATLVHEADHSSSELVDPTFGIPMGRDADRRRPDLPRQSDRGTRRPVLFADYCTGEVFGSTRARWACCACRCSRGRSLPSRRASTVR